MKVRVNIARIAISEPSMSRRQRSALGDQISSELKHLLDPGVASTDSAARQPQRSVAADIAGAIAAQLPPQRRGTRG